MTQALDFQPPCARLRRQRFLRGELCVERSVREAGASNGAAQRTLRVCALYPDLMNIYADRGNLLMLERRCA